MPLSFDQGAPQTVGFATHDRLAVITLNRPAALNALSQAMCLAIDGALTALATDSQIAAVMITGGACRAFCAGGDVRAVHDDGVAHRRGESDGALCRDFFRDEYRMNRRIRCFPKPYIAIMDGITMGGGVGLSVHGCRRVATERSLFAMPETSIGLFPDIGSSYVLPRLPGNMGLYLALTGGRLGASEMRALGLATHVVSSASIGKLTEDLIAASSESDANAAIDRVLGHHAAPPTTRDRIRNRAAIDRCFAADSVEEILKALDDTGSAFATNAAAAMRAASPTSLKVTLELMRRGASLSFEECLVMEYRLTQSFMAGSDFYEGVRAQLIDKDRTPHWAPDSLAAVDEANIPAFFAPPAHGDLTFGA